MKHATMILLVAAIAGMLIGTGVLVEACGPHHQTKPRSIYVWKPYSSNCGPDHYPRVVDGSWDTWEWCSLGDTLYFNYTIYPKAKTATWHVGYHESEGASHINESIVIPNRFLKNTGHDRLLHLRVQRVEGNCWWDDEWNFSVWNPRTRSWETLLLTTGGMDSSFYDTGVMWVIR